MSGPPYVYGPSTGRYLTTPLDWAKCGSEANAKAHYRRGEKPCDACREAVNRAHTDRARRRANA